MLFLTRITPLGWRGVDARLPMAKSRALLVLVPTRRQPKSNPHTRHAREKNRQNRGLTYQRHYRQTRVSRVRCTGSGTQQQRFELRRVRLLNVGSGWTANAGGGSPTMMYAYDFATFSEEVCASTCSQWGCIDYRFTGEACYCTHPTGGGGPMEDQFYLLPPSASLAANPPAHGAAAVAIRPRAVPGRSLLPSPR